MELHHTLLTLHVAAHKGDPAGWLLWLVNDALRKIVLWILEHQAVICRGELEVHWFAFILRGDLRPVECSGIGEIDVEKLDGDRVIAKHHEAHPLIVACIQPFPFFVEDRTVLTGIIDPFTNELVDKDRGASQS